MARADDLLGVFADGSVRVASALDRRTGRYAKVDLAATIPVQLRGKVPLRAVAGDFDGDGRTDAVLVADDGKVLLLRNASASNGPPRFDCLDTDALLPAGLRRVCCRPFPSGPVTNWSGTTARAIVLRAGWEFPGVDRPRLVRNVEVLTVSPDGSPGRRPLPWAEDLRPDRRPAALAWRRGERNGHASRIAH